MLHTKTHKIGEERNLITVSSDRYICRDGTYLLLGWVERDYEHGGWIASITKVNRYGRFPRKVKVSSIRNGFRFLIKADGKLKL